MKTLHGLRKYWILLVLGLCHYVNAQTPTFTNTPTNTSTFTATSTYTNTITNTPTQTFTITNTFTATFTPTNTPTPTNTFTATYTPTPTAIPGQYFPTGGTMIYRPATTAHTYAFTTSISQAVTFVNNPYQYPVMDIYLNNANGVTFTVTNLMTGWTLPFHSATDNAYEYSTTTGGGGNDDILVSLAQAGQGVVLNVPNGGCTLIVSLGSYSDQGPSMVTAFENWLTKHSLVIGTPTPTPTPTGSLTPTATFTPWIPLNQQFTQASLTPTPLNTPVPGMFTDLIVDDFENVNIAGIAAPWMALTMGNTIIYKHAPGTTGSIIPCAPVVYRDYSGTAVWGVIPPQSASATFMLNYRFFVHGANTPVPNPLR